MNKLQEQFDKCTSGSFVMIAGEYEGPLVINKPCVVDGSKSTVWAQEGPVITVDSAGVTLKNLRVEVTGDGESAVAIETKHDDTVMDQVEARGNLRGFAAEQEDWSLPTEIKLGSFAAEEKNTFKVELYAASDAEIVCGIRDLSVQPKQLKAGLNTLTVETGKIRDNVILYGDMFVKSLVMRRIGVIGKSVKGAPVRENELIVKAPERAASKVEVPSGLKAPEVGEVNVRQLRRGQRISVDDLKDTVITVSYEYESKKEKTDIDGYAFLLNKDGKVSCDEDFVFFGNADSPDHSVKAGSVDGMAVITIEPSKIGRDTEKVAICYSIYGEDNDVDFSQIKRQTIHISADDEEVYRCELSGLSAERTVVALEIYRYKGGWRLNFVGSGYRNDLKQLCESYGVAIED